MPYASKEKQKENRLKYWEENRESLLKKAKEWRDKNKDSIVSKRKEHYEANKSRLNFERDSR